MNLELMLRVKARILAEPDLVDMNAWIYNKRIITGSSTLMGEEIPIYGCCRTSACIFGHCAIESDMADGEFYKMASTEVIKIGAELLGISEGEADALFFFYEEYEKPGHFYADLGLRLSRCSTGTIKYAAIVAEAIDRCIERNHKEPDVCTQLDAAGPVMVEGCASEAEVVLALVPVV